MSGALFDWPALMRAGLQGLGLMPDAFWRLTPAELLLMLGDAPDAAPLRRAGLEALLVRFPDMAKKENGHDRDG
ncbi:rcc01693 family protein [Roseicyclus sp.]|uniref:rcc01693 family protein n=1 Tax=Roseicyclus sp. TaxID=1914329 RepID=UPI003F6BA78B